MMEESAVVLTHFALVTCVWCYCCGKAHKKTRDKDSEPYSKRRTPGDKSDSSGGLLTSRSYYPPKTTGQPGVLPDTKYVNDLNFEYLEDKLDGINSGVYQRKDVPSNSEQLNTKVESKSVPSSASPAQIVDKETSPKREMDPFNKRTYADSVQNGVADSGISERSDISDGESSTQRSQARGPTYPAAFSSAEAYQPLTTLPSSSAFRPIGQPGILRDRIPQRTAFDGHKSATLPAKPTGDHEFNDVLQQTELNKSEMELLRSSWSEKEKHRSGGLSASGSLGDVGMSAVNSTIQSDVSTSSVIPERELSQPTSQGSLGLANDSRTPADTRQYASSFGTVEVYDGDRELTPETQRRTIAELTEIQRHVSGELSETEITKTYRIRHTVKTEDADSGIKEPTPEDEFAKPYPLHLSVSGSEGEPAQLVDDSTRMVTKPASSSVTDEYLTHLSHMLMDDCKGFHEDTGKDPTDVHIHYYPGLNDAGLNLLRRNHSPGSLEEPRTKVTKTEIVDVDTQTLTKTVQDGKSEYITKIKFHGSEVAPDMCENSSQSVSLQEPALTPDGRGTVADQSREPTDHWSTAIAARQDDRDVHIHYPPVIGYDQNNNDRQVRPLDQNANVVQPQAEVRSRDVPVALRPAEPVEPDHMALQRTTDVPECVNGPFSGQLRLTDDTYALGLADRAPYQSDFDISELKKYNHVGNVSNRTTDTTNISICSTASEEPGFQATFTEAKNQYANIYEAKADCTLDQPDRKYVTLVNETAGRDFELSTSFPLKSPTRSLEPIESAPVSTYNVEEMEMIVDVRTDDQMMGVEYRVSPKREPERLTAYIQPPMHQQEATAAHQFTVQETHDVISSSQHQEVWVPYGFKRGEDSASTYSHMGRSPDTHLSTWTGPHFDESKVAASNIAAAPVQSKAVALEASGRQVEISITEDVTKMDTVTVASTSVPESDAKLQNQADLGTVEVLAERVDIERTLPKNEAGRVLAIVDAPTVTLAVCRPHLVVSACFMCKQAMAGNAMLPSVGSVEVVRIDTVFACCRPLALNVVYVHVVMDHFNVWAGLIQGVAFSVVVVKLEKHVLTENVSEVTHSPSRLTATAEPFFAGGSSYVHFSGTEVRRAIRLESLYTYHARHFEHCFANFATVKTHTLDASFTNLELWESTPSFLCAETKIALCTFSETEPSSIVSFFTLASLVPSASFLVVGCMDTAVYTKVELGTVYAVANVLSVPMLYRAVESVGTSMTLRLSLNEVISAAGTLKAVYRSWHSADFCKNIEDGAKFAEVVLTQLTQSYFADSMLVRSPETVFADVKEHKLCRLENTLLVCRDIKRVLVQSFYPLREVATTATERQFSNCPCFAVVGKVCAIIPMLAIELSSHGVQSMSKQFGFIKTTESQSVSLLHQCVARLKLTSPQIPPFNEVHVNINERRWLERSEASLHLRTRASGTREKLEFRTHVERCQIDEEKTARPGIHGGETMVLIHELPLEQVCVSVAENSNTYNLTEIIRQSQESSATSFTRLSEKKIYSVSCNLLETFTVNLIVFLDNKASSMSFKLQSLPEVVKEVVRNKFHIAYAKSYLDANNTRSNVAGAAYVQEELVKYKTDSISLERTECIAESMLKNRTAESGHAFITIVDQVIRTQQDHAFTEASSVCQNFDVYKKETNVSTTANLLIRNKMSDKVYADTCEARNTTIFKHCSDLRSISEATVGIFKSANILTQSHTVNFQHTFLVSTLCAQSVGYSTNVMVPLKRQDCCSFNLRGVAMSRIESFVQKNSRSDMKLVVLAQCLTNQAFINLKRFSQTTLNVSQNRLSARENVSASIPFKSKTGICVGRNLTLEFTGYIQTLHGKAQCEAQSVRLQTVSLAEIVETVFYEQADMAACYTPGFYESTKNDMMLSGVFYEKSKYVVVHNLLELESLSIMMIFENRRAKVSSCSAMAHEICKELVKAGFNVMYAKATVQANKEPANSNVAYACSEKSAVFISPLLLHGIIVTSADLSLYQDEKLKHQNVESTLGKEYVKLAFVTSFKELVNVEHSFSGTKPWDQVGTVSVISLKNLIQSHQNLTECSRIDADFLIESVVRQLYEVEGMEASSCSTYIDETVFHQYIYSANSIVAQTVFYSTVISMGIPKCCECSSTIQCGSTTSSEVNFERSLECLSSSFEQKAAINLQVGESLSFYKAEHYHEVSCPIFNEDIQVLLRSTNVSRSHATVFHEQADLVASYTPGFSQVSKHNVDVSDVVSKKLKYAVIHNVLELQTLSIMVFFERRSPKVSFCCDIVQEVCKELVRAGFNVMYARTCLQAAKEPKCSTVTYVDVEKLASTVTTNTMQGVVVTTADWNLYQEQEQQNQCTYITINKEYLKLVFVKSLKEMATAMHSFTGVKAQDFVGTAFVIRLKDVIYDLVQCSLAECSHIDVDLIVQSIAHQMHGSECVMASSSSMCVQDTIFQKYLHSDSSIIAQSVFYSAAINIGIPRRCKCSSMVHGVFKTFVEFDFNKSAVGQNHQHLLQESTSATFLANISEFSKTQVHAALGRPVEHESLLFALKQKNHQDHEEKLQVFIARSFAENAFSLRETIKAAKCRIRVPSHDSVLFRCRTEDTAVHVFHFSSKKIQQKISSHATLADKSCDTVDSLLGTIESKSLFCDYRHKTCDIYSTSYVKAVKALVSIISKTTFRLAFVNVVAEASRPLHLLNADVIIRVHSEVSESCKTDKVRLENCEASDSIKKDVLEDSAECCIKEHLYLSVVANIGEIQLVFLEKWTHYKVPSEHEIEETFVFAPREKVQLGKLTEVSERDILVSFSKPSSSYDAAQNVKEKRLTTVSSDPCHGVAATGIDTAAVLPTQNAQASPFSVSEITRDRVNLTSLHGVATTTVNTSLKNSPDECETVSLQKERVTVRTSLENFRPIQTTQCQSDCRKTPEHVETLHVSKAIAYLKTEAMSTSGVEHTEEQAQFNKVPENSAIEKAMPEIQAAKADLSNIGGVLCTEAQIYQQNRQICEGANVTVRMANKDTTFSEQLHGVAVVCSASDIKKGDLSSSSESTQHEKQSETAGATMPAAVSMQEHRNSSERRAGSFIWLEDDKPRQKSPKKKSPPKRKTPPKEKSPSKKSASPPVAQIETIDAVAASSEKRMSSASEESFYEARDHFDDTNTTTSVDVTKPSSTESADLIIMQQSIDGDAPVRLRPALNEELENSMQGKITELTEEEITEELFNVSHGSSVKVAIEKEVIPGDKVHRVKEALPAKVEGAGVLQQRIYESTEELEEQRVLKMKQEGRKDLLVRSIDSASCCLTKLA